MTGRFVLDVDVGSRLWLVLAASLIAVAIGGIIVMWLVSAAFVAWGLLGLFVLVGGIAIVFGWFYDRRRPPPLERI